MTLFPIGARVGADTTQFVSSIGAAASGLRAFTGAAGLANTAMVAFAGAAVMGAAVAAAREYQAELLKLNTLVGIQTEQIEEWDQAMRGIAESTGRAPADLARAMFAITSGGARGTEALNILESAAQASAIGLGDMTSIGRTATAALQAFGEQGLTAEKAIDVLTATVRAGNLEAESLSGSFGRVMGTAAALGLQFEDLGAFVATYTRLGVDAQVATTGLNAALNLILRPMDSARDKMEELGIPVEQLRRQLREEGLNATLQTMRDAIGDNIDALGTVIPNIRAMAAVLGTVGVQSEEYAQIQQDINDSLGLTAEGFETWGQSADATFDRFIAQAKTTGITIGETLLPPLTVLLQLLQPLLDLLALSARGWQMLGGAIRQAGEDILAVITPAQRQLTLQERMAESTQNLIDRFGELSNEQLELIQGQLTARIDRLTAAMERGGEVAERAALQREGELGMLRAVNAELTRRIIGEVEVAEVVEERAQAERELTEEEQKRLDSIHQIIGGLQDQRLVLEEGEFALIAQRLEHLQAGEAAIEYARALFEAIEAIEAERDAQEEASRATERARREREREIERARDAARRAAERQDLAEIQDEIRQLTRLSENMAQAFADAFTDIITGTENVADAFSDMVTFILNELARLAIQRAIVEPLAGAIFGAFGGSALESRAAGIGSGFRTDLPGGQAVLGVSAEQVGITPVIVQQSITFAPSFIDGADGDRWLRSQSQTIMGIVGEGAQRSSEFASIVRGGTR